MKVFKLLSALSSITLLCVISCTMYILYISSPGSTRVKLTHNRAAVTRKKQTTYDWNISEDTRLDQLFAGLTVEPLNATMRATDIDIRGKVCRCYYIHVVWVGLATYSLELYRVYYIIGLGQLHIVVLLVSVWWAGRVSRFTALLAMHIYNTLVRILFIFSLSFFGR